MAGLVFGWLESRAGDHCNNACAYAQSNPAAGKAFMANGQGIFHDLKGDARGFRMGRNRWPLSACRLRAHFTGRTEPWRPQRGSGVGAREAA